MDKKPSRRPATRAAAICTIFDAPRMTKRGRKVVAEWLRRQAWFLEAHAAQLSKRYVARYLYPVALIATLALPSCTAISKATDAADRAVTWLEEHREDSQRALATVAEIAGQVQAIAGKVSTDYEATVSGVREKVAEIKAQVGALDKDGDGKVSMTEGIAGLVGLGGLGVLRNWMSARDKTKTFAQIQQELAAVKAKVPVS